MGRVTHLQWLLFVAFLASTAAAPYLKTSTGQGQEQLPLDHIFSPSQGLIGPLFRLNDHSVDPPTHGGCYYQFRHYDEGDRIVTNEPCLNCTCHNSMLMCYLKVCPFSKPIGQDCKVEKNDNQCCPVITCPQVPVNLKVMYMTSSTTTLSPSSTEVVPYTEHGCTIEGEFYPDGAKVPGDLRKPCELCYCIRNHTACLMQECILKVEGCKPVFKSGECCPVRYMCAYDDTEIAEITTTMLPTVNDSVVMTTTMAAQIGGCTHNMEFYADGASIPSEDPCEHCYCMKNDIVCAIQECRSPLDEDDEKCVPRLPLPGKCCPEAYDCPETLDSSTILPFGIIPETTLASKTELLTDIPDVPLESLLTTIEPETLVDKATTPKVVEMVHPVAATPSIEDLKPKIKEDNETESSAIDTVFETRTIGPDDEMFLTTTPITISAPEHDLDITKLTVEPEIETITIEHIDEIEIVPEVVDTTTPVKELTTADPSLPDAQLIITEKPITTIHPDITTIIEEVVTTAPVDPKIPGEGNCLVNTTTYKNGDVVPATSPCQEKCNCRNSVVSCQLTACPSAPPSFLNCETQKRSNKCCPVYNCPITKPDETPSPNCIRDDQQYLEGEFIPSPDLCTDCYCLYGDIICAYKECPQVDQNCTPLKVPKGSCCPTKYECPELQIRSMMQSTLSPELAKEDDQRTTILPTILPTDPSLEFDAEIQEDGTDPVTEKHIVVEPVTDPLVEIQESDVEKVPVTTVLSDTAIFVTEEPIVTEPIKVPVLDLQVEDEKEVELVTTKSPDQVTDIDIAPELVTDPVVEMQEEVDIIKIKMTESSDPVIGVTEPVVVPDVDVKVTTMKPSVPVITVTEKGLDPEPIIFPGLEIQEDGEKLDLTTTVSSAPVITVTEKDIITDPSIKIQDDEIEMVLTTTELSDPALTATEKYIIDEPILVSVGEIPEEIDSMKQVTTETVGLILEVTKDEILTDPLKVPDEIKEDDVEMKQTIQELSDPELAVTEPDIHIEVDTLVYDEEIELTTTEPIESGKPVIEKDDVMKPIIEPVVGIQELEVKIKQPIIDPMDPFTVDSDKGVTEPTIYPEVEIYSDDGKIELTTLEPKVPIITATEKDSAIEIITTVSGEVLDEVDKIKPSTSKPTDVVQSFTEKESVTEPIMVPASEVLDDGDEIEKVTTEPTDVGKIVTDPVPDILIPEDEVETMLAQTDPSDLVAEVIDKDIVTEFITVPDTITQEEDHVLEFTTPMTSDTVREVTKKDHVTEPLIVLGEEIYEDGDDDKLVTTESFVTVTAVTKEEIVTELADSVVETLDEGEILLKVTVPSDPAVVVTAPTKVSVAEEVDDDADIRLTTTIPIDPEIVITQAEIVTDPSLVHVIELQDDDIDEIKFTTIVPTVPVSVATEALMIPAVEIVEEVDEIAKTTTEPSDLVITATEETTSEHIMVAEAELPPDIVKIEPATTAISDPDTEITKEVATEPTIVSVDQVHIDDTEIILTRAKPSRPEEIVIEDDVTIDPILLPEIEILDDDVDVDEATIAPSDPGVTTTEKLIIMEPVTDPVDTIRVDEIEKDRVATLAPDSVAIVTDDILDSKVEIKEITEAELVTMSPPLPSIAVTEEDIISVPSIIPAIEIQEDSEDIKLTTTLPIATIVSATEKDIVIDPAIKVQDDDDEMVPITTEMPIIPIKSTTEKVIATEIEMQEVVDEIERTTTESFDPVTEFAETQIITEPFKVPVIQIQEDVDEMELTTIKPLDIVSIVTETVGFAEPVIIEDEIEIQEDGDVIDLTKLAPVDPVIEEDGITESVIDHEIDVQDVGVKIELTTTEPMDPVAMVTEIVDFTEPVIIEDEIEIQDDGDVIDLTTPAPLDPVIEEDDTTESVIDHEIDTQDVGVKIELTTREPMDPVAMVTEIVGFTEPVIVEDEIEIQEDGDVIDLTKPAPLDPVIEEDGITESVIDHEIDVQDVGVKIELTTTEPMDPVAMVTEIVEPKPDKPQVEIIDDVKIELTTVGKADPIITVTDPIRVPVTEIQDDGIDEDIISIIDSLDVLQDDDVEIMEVTTEFYDVVEAVTKNDTVTDPIIVPVEIDEIKPTTEGTVEVQVTDTAFISVSERDEVDEIKLTTKYPSELIHDVTKKDFVTESIIVKDTHIQEDGEEIDVTTVPSDIVSPVTEQYVVTDSHEGPAIEMQEIEVAEVPKTETTISVFTVTESVTVPVVSEVDVATKPSHEPVIEIQDDEADLVQHIPLVEIPEEVATDPTIVHGIEIQEDSDKIESSTPEGQVEGCWWFDNKEYEHGAIVAPLRPCEKNCSCQNGTVICDDSSCETTKSTTELSPEAPKVPMISTTIAGITDKPDDITEIPSKELVDELTNITVETTKGPVEELSTPVTIIEKTPAAPVESVDPIVGVTEESIDIPEIPSKELVDELTNITVKTTKGPVEESSTPVTIIEKTQATTVESEVPIVGVTEESIEIPEIPSVEVIEEIPQKELVDEISVPAPEVSIANITDKPIDIIITTSQMPIKDITTSAPLITTLLSVATEGCWWFDNNEYEHEDNVPPNNKCQENCKCNNGTITCQHKACPTAPSAFLRCESVTSDDSCCPTYDCVPSTSDKQCNYEGKTYLNNEYIPSKSNCKECHCLDGDAVCAVLECVAPQHNCVAIAQGECCPTDYECAEDTSVSVTTSSPEIKEGVTTESKEALTTLKPISPVTEIMTKPELPRFDEADGDLTVPEIFIPHSTIKPSTMISPELVEIIESTYIPPLVNATQTTTWRPTTTTEFVLGPGSCLYDANIYVSAQQIPRDDACDFCFCFRGDIICLQQTCPPPIPGCFEEAISGFCCPRYECPANPITINVPKPTRPPLPVFPLSSKNSRLNACEIEGKHYAIGEVIEAASSNCHQCKCGEGALMKCLPIECDTHRKLYKYR